MTQFELADALDKIAEGYAAAAMVLRIGAETPQDAPGAPSFDELPFDDSDAPAAEAVAATPHGSEAVCPSHGIAFLHGKNNTMFCPAKSDDPKWSNQRGYCTVTPKSAAAWLRQKAAAG